MSLRTMKKSTGRPWDTFQIPDIVIDWVNILVKYQQ